MSGKNGAIKLVAGNSNPALAAAIGDYLKTPLTKAVVRRFADGEVFVEIQENVRGADVFVTKLSSLGSSLSYSVRLGGSGADYGASLGLDATNQVYGTGVTFSTNFPTSTNGYQKTSGGGLDAVLFRLSVTGNTLGTSTYLGGSGDDEGIGIAVDADNNRVVLCGVTTSANFPTRNPYQSSYYGS